MRTEKEMMDMILNVAIKDSRVRMVTLEGSRTNVNVKPDEYQDYDISFLVTELDSYLVNEEWLEIFGRRIIMQKPEDMELFEPDLGGWFSYLMLFEDGNRIDLTLVPLEDLDKYLAGDKLMLILLDKDNLVPDPPVPTDIEYHVKRPTVRQFDDCCNEFWWVCTYVVKGLLRKEFLFAADHFYLIVRKELIRMIAWNVGYAENFSRNLGKNQKELENTLSKEVWEQLISTYAMGSYEELWIAFEKCMQLFRDVSKEVSQKLGIMYPDYDERITKWIDKQNWEGANDNKS